MPDASNFKQDYYLWEGSYYSVFVIPINTGLICFALRLLFCKVHVELMKVMLMVDLVLLYIFSCLGLICYLISSSESDNFKQ